jgi:hypothetical protein
VQHLKQVTEPICGLGYKHRGQHACIREHEVFQGLGSVHGIAAAVGFQHKLAHPMDAWVHWQCVRVCVCVLLDFLKKEKDDFPQQTTAAIHAEREADMRSFIKA